MSRLFEVTMTRTQTAKYQIYAEDWEEAENKAYKIMKDSDFITDESAGDLKIDTEEIDKVLSRYVIDTSLSAIEIYAYDLEDAIHKVKQMLKDSNEILGLPKPVVDNKSDDNKSDTSTPDDKLLDMIRDIQQLMDEEGRNIHFNRHAECFIELLHTCLGKSYNNCGSIEFCLYDFIDNLVKDNYPAIKASAASLLHAVYKKEELNEN